MNIPFLDMKAVNAPFADAIQRALCDTFMSGYYLCGPNTKTFQKKLAASCGSPLEAVAVSNGLDALRLIFKSLLLNGKLKEGDEVLVPANTYIASILPLTEMGLTPVLVEPSAETMNLDWEEALKKTTTATRALLVTHLYGTPCWNSDIAAEMRRRGVLIIEDNAQAIGAFIEDGRRTGSLGDAAAFSFYPTKNIGALGDAGAVTSQMPELIETVRALANYGSDRRYHNIYCGYNCRMDETQAAVLNIKLDALEEISRHRRATAALYDSLITNSLVVKPHIMPHEGQVWHQYVVRLKERDRFRDYLSARGIATDIHYATPPHRQPCYRGILEGDYPLTDLLAKEVVSLPIASVTDAQAVAIAKAINDFKP